MARLPQSCCCCCSLKTGATTLGSLGIVSYTLVFFKQQTTYHLHDLQIGSLLLIPSLLLGYDNIIQQQAQHLGYEGKTIFPSLMTMSKTFF
jgi:hypothetical protein